MTHASLIEFDAGIADPAIAPLDLFKACINAGSDELAQRYRAGEPVETLVRDHARFIDEVLRRAWALHMPEQADAALIAVGGYGRAELHPKSDVDVLILTGDEPASLIDHIEQFVMLLWDMGLEIGHSARSLTQCIDEAKKDMTVMTNLIESRWICGKEALYSTVRNTTSPAHMWPSDLFFNAKLVEQEARHRKYDDTAYNLEPNIKENPGGLRDIQMIGWVAKRHFGAQTMSDLVDHHFLTDQEYQLLVSCQSLLWRIRFALHLLTGRHEDRLLFDYQRALALEFGYRDEKENLGVEQFMQAYYRAVICLNRLNEMLLQLFREAILLKDNLGEVVPINRRFQARNGYLEVVNPGIFAQRPLALLEVFLLLQQHPGLQGVAAGTIRLIRAHRHLIDRRFRADIKARSLFIEILRQPAGITLTLRHMNRYGILARYLPAFGNIVGRMQYDLFHVYTVDEHTLRMIRELRRFSQPALSHELPLCSRIFQTLPKHELIYIAGLFHDIAKGRGGDHSLLGARDAWDFCKLHGLSNFDARLVTWLVEKHLLMSFVAQRKDIEDPMVVQDFAREVGDFNRLDHLYVLTVADIRSTNPKRWNSWKNVLLGQLYTSARRALSRGLDSPEQQDDLVAQKQQDARAILAKKGFVDQTVTRLWASLSIDYFLQATPAEIAWQAQIVLEADDLAIPLVEIRPAARGGATEIFVCAPDRDNLFAHSTALLSQLQLNVLAARIQTADSGCTMNSFFVLEEDGELMQPGERYEEVAATMRIGLAEPETFDPTVSRHVPRHLKHFDIPVEVDYQQDAANQRTELRLRAADHPGFLSRVGQAFAECGIRVHHAKITTVGATVEDTYYVTDQDNRMLTDPQMQHQLTEALKHHISV